MSVFVWHEDCFNPIVCPRHLTSGSIMNKSAPIAGMRGTEGQDRPIERIPGQHRRRLLMVIGSIGAGIALLAVVWSATLNFFSSERAVPLAAVRVAIVARGRFVSDVSAQGTVVAALSPKSCGPAAAAGRT